MTDRAPPPAKGDPPQELRALREVAASQRDRARNFLNQLFATGDGVSAIAIAKVA